MPSLNLLLADPASLLMSARTSLLTSVGSASPSTSARSGTAPALFAVSSLVTCSSPCACLLTVTWMSGCELFHIATTLSRFGTQDQNASSTLPLLVVLDPPPELQATMAAHTRRTPAARANLDLIAPSEGGSAGLDAAVS